MKNLPKYAINKLASSNYAYHLDNPKRKMTDAPRMWKATSKEMFGTVYKDVEEVDVMNDAVLAKWLIVFENRKPSWYERR